ncbi:HEPN domain-containing protein [Candidatus Amarolinea dominans]|uniref:HEPN domain-containing protein n=1 Tax=Candidatus Amarolinea dominans TaxID=3140696 RepID=UPI0031CC8603
MDEDTKLLVGIRLERCREDIATARLLIREGKYRVAVSRAYYAIFMIATAVLITLGISRSKHSAVESAFGHYLVKAAPKGLNVVFEFSTENPAGALRVRLARGKRQDADALILEMVLISEDADAPATPADFPAWLDAAHNVIHDTFFKMIEGRLESSSDECLAFESVTTWDAVRIAPPVANGARGESCLPRSRQVTLMPCASPADLAPGHDLI